jgi:ABC-2 type transport system permease protein
VRLWFDATWGIVRRDAILFFSYRSQTFTQIVGLLFNLTVFFYISRLLTGETIETPGGYFAFVVVGLVIVQVLTTSMGITPTQVRQELVSGTIERFLVSAHGPVHGIVGMMLFPLASAFATGAIMLAIAAIVFGMPLEPTAPLAIPVAALGALAFLPFALALVAAVIAFKQVASGAQFIVSGVAIVGGLYFPVTLLPGWIAWTADVQPFTPAADVLRHLLVGAPLADPIIVDLAKLVAFAAVLLPVGVLLLRAAVRYGQRVGTIAEY